MSIGRTVNSELKKVFPGVKFSVISDYDRVHISWTNGPSSKNDFTKEELENILTCVNAISYNNEASSLTLKSSQDKIQSLIDNYCEHDTIGGEIDLFIDTCSKCNAFILSK